MTYENSDEQGGTRTDHPGLRLEVGCFGPRLKEAIGSTSVRTFAIECGLSEGVLRSYLRGASYPTLDRLAAIAHASHRPMAWFVQTDADSAAGNASHPVTLDTQTITSALKMLSWAFELQGAIYDPARDPDLLAETYAFLIEHDGSLTPDNLVDFSKRLAQRRAKEASDARK